MSIKSSVRSLKNILQDAVIRIPYFASTLKATTTIAAICMMQSQDNRIDYTEQITVLLKQLKEVVGFQSKLYYEKQSLCKTLIIQFEDLETSQKFYSKYAKNCDKTLIAAFHSAQNQPNSKFTLYFCKDISSNGINMQDILYNLGRFCVQAPQSQSLRNLIKQVAKLVVVEGIRAEQQIQTCKNLVLPSSSLNLFNFMNPNYLSSEAIYYRWRVYSYLQGDGDKNYRLQPFQMTLGGPIYYPPDELSQKYNYKVLNYLQRQYVTKLLQSLSSRKFHIQQAMSFCISNEGSAIQICCIIAICIVETCMKLSEEQGKANKPNDIKHLTGLFYLISDILFNTTSTVYRDIFTVLLPPLMQRIPKINDLNQKISQTVVIWSKKFLLQDQFLRGITLSSKRQLPSMSKLGMQQMTRSEHECFKDLLKIETTEQVQQLCWKYGIAFSNQKIDQSFRNLAAVLAVDKKQATNQMQPEPGPFDGDPLNEKDIQKIKGKACRVVSCQEITVKNLWEKDKTSKSISND